MRFLVYAVLGFAAACAAGAYGLSISLWFCIPILIFVFLSFFLRLSKPGVVLLGAVLGLCWFWFFDTRFLAPVRAMDGVTQETSVRIMDYSWETDYGRAAHAAICIGEREYSLRVYLDEGEPLAPGQELTGTFLFRTTLAAGEEEGTYHPGKGIFLLAYQRGDVSCTSGEKRLSEVPAKLRRSIQEILKAAFPEDTSPFARALLMGDTSDLTYEVDTALKISGIRHVAAVSGLHVSILFAFISTVSFRKRSWMALLGFPALLLFAAVSGFTPSVCRASIMSGLMLLALLLDQEYDGPSALAFAVLVMLSYNPMVISSVGFQLSVASVAGIYLFCGRIQNWILSLFPESAGGKKLRSWFAASVATSLSAMTLTSPLCGVYFGTVSLVSILTNLLTLWIISFVFYGIMAVCLLYLWLPGAAMVLAGVLSVPIRFVLGTARLLSRFPLAAVYTVSSYICVWLVFVYLLLGIFLVMKKRRPGLLLGTVVLSLLVSVFAGWMEPNFSDVRFTVLDVGQGQCLLFQSEGKNILVDCGGSTEAADLAAETLLSQGFSRLDAVIVTHMDDDHVNGLQNLLWRMDVRLLILPAEPNDLLLSAATKVVYAAEDLELSFGACNVQIFAPKFQGSGNENSNCVLFDTEKCDILITGDRSAFGEQSLMRNADIPRVDVLVAGHHGALDSTSMELLQRTQPEIVCISAGADNPYGHPHPQLLDRLEAWDCQVFRTDLQGTILIRR